MELMKTKELTPEIVLAKTPRDLGKWIPIVLRLPERFSGHPKAELTSRHASSLH